MHGPWLRIELGVMLARGFSESGRIGGELVPRSIEVDALAAGDESLHIRAAKAEMPEERVFEDFLPWSDARQRRIHQNKPRDPAWVLRCEGIADHIADVVGDEVC